jgi:hypothetical protein
MPWPHARIDLSTDTSNANKLANFFFQIDIQQCNFAVLLLIITFDTNQHSWLIIIA